MRGGKIVGFSLFVEKYNRYTYICKRDWWDYRISGGGTLMGGNNVRWNFSKFG